MEQKVKDVVTNLDEIGFKELMWALSIANRVRQMMKRYNLTVEYLSESLCIEKEVCFEIMKGSYDFDIMTISKIEALSETLEMEFAKKNIIPLISFPDYKYTETQSL